MKTFKLTGAALDWAVAQCENFPVRYGFDDNCPEYSTNWAQGGPIIERKCIDLQYQGGNVDVWAADMFGADCSVYGDTPLIAAMRCYVTSKLGDEVEIPEELTA